RLDAVTGRGRPDCGMLRRPPRRQPTGGALPAQRAGPTVHPRAALQRLDDQGGPPPPRDPGAHHLPCAGAVRRRRRPAGAERDPAHPRAVNVTMLVAAAAIVFLAALTTGYTGFAFNLLTVPLLS